jgi:tRNA (guanine26-N2/guanine27-N2)-dimethyltransferase
MGGPIWGEALHDADFVQSCLANLTANREAFGTAARMEGMLSVIGEELADAPLYYTINGLAGILHCQTPPMRDILCVCCSRI